jgi:hypothetical protein
MGKKKPSGAFAFELPFGDSAVAARLIQAVPPTWSWITGQLDAPVASIFNGRTGVGGYIMDRWDSVVISTLDNVSGDRFWALDVPERSSLIADRRQAVVELATQQVQPLFVRFREAGFDHGEYGSAPFEQMKQVAISYIGKGYLGDLSFHSDCYDSVSSYSPESCDIHLAPFSSRWNRSEDLTGPTPTHGQLVEAMRSGDIKLIEQLKQALSPPKRQYPALIKVTWEERYGGRGENVQGLLDTCRELGLTELDPEPIDYGHSFAEPKSW